MPLRPLKLLPVCLVAAVAHAQQTPAQVRPVAETATVPSGSGDVVEAVAIWVHPQAPGRSLVLIADAQAGLVTYGLDGLQRQLALTGHVTGVDVRDGFSIGAVQRPLVATANAQGLSLLTLTHQGDGSTRVDFLRTFQRDDVRSVALYRSRTSGFYAFVGDESGRFVQLALRAEADGGISATEARVLELGGEARAAVADDDLGQLFIAETQTGRLWRFDAEPTGSPDGGVLVEAGDGGTLTGPVRGLGLYALGGSAGYLVAATEADGTFTVLDRAAPHTPRGRFMVVQDGGLDTVNAPRALALSSQPLVDAGYPGGILVAHDDVTETGAENAKLVAWNAIAGAFSPALGSTTQLDGGTGNGGDGGGGGGGVLPPGPGGSLPPGEDDDGPACSCTASSVPGAALLGLMAVLLRRRRSS